MIDGKMSPSIGAEAGSEALVKKPTGIVGFDEIAGGGLPRGRLIGLIGGPGSGKTVFALQTLVNRARQLGEGGIFVSFEEPLERLRANAVGFDWDFDRLEGERIILVDGRLPIDTMLTGEFDLSGLLAQVGALAAQIGAANVVFDGLDLLLSGLPDIERERRELRRIDDWILAQSVSCIVTGKSVAHGDRELMRQDYLHYITDVVVTLDGRLYDGAFTRVLRIIKYRGSEFAANAFPAVITQSGIQVIAKTKARLSYPTSDERLSTGVAGLDRLVDGGYRRGTTTLITGAPGTAKTSMAGHFTLASCQRGETALFVSFDESDSQIINDLSSIGIDLESHRASGRLIVVSLRAASRSPDSYFVELRGLLDKYAPSCFVLDPVSALIRPNYPFASEICEYLLDEARARGITTLCTSLSGVAVNDQELSVSSLSTIADTWIHLTYNSRGGERNRALTIVKSRGTAHSNQVREIVVGCHGLELVDIYSAEGEVLMGSARAQREAAERQRNLDLEQRQAYEEFTLRQSMSTLELQLQTIQTELDWKRKEADLLREQAASRAMDNQAAAAERLNLRGSGREGS